MTSGPPRRRATPAARRGRDRASYLARRLGTALRERRLAAGLSQRQLGERAGLSQTEVSRLERGNGTGSGLDVWTACGAAVGAQLATFFENAPGADAPRDLEHLRRQNLVVGYAARGGWVAVPEAALAHDGPRPRSIDVYLTRRDAREAAIVEVWDLLADGGQAMRGLTEKVLAVRARLGPTWRVQGLLVLRRTSRNRALVRELEPLFAARFPASSAGWLGAMADPHTPMPKEGGFAWTDVAGTRLMAARLRSAR